MKKLDSKKIIMGIDPGTNILGYGVIAIDQGGPELLTLGTLDMRKEKDPFKKLDTIFTDTGKIMDLYRRQKRGSLWKARFLSLPQAG